MNANKCPEAAKASSWVVGKNEAAIRKLAINVSAVSDAPPSQHQTVDVHCGGASDTALTFIGSSGAAGIRFDGKFGVA